MKDVRLLQRLGAERSRNAALAADLASAREQIARSFHARLVAVVGGHGEEATTIAERLRRAADPDLSSDTPLSMTVRLGGETILADNADRSARSIVFEPPRVDESDDGQTRRASAGDEPVPLPNSHGSPISTAGLPDAQQLRVVVRCARGARLARERAKAIGDNLRARGLEVAEPVDARGPIDDGRVTYWYRADLADAERIADLASLPAPIRGRLPSHGRLPRPGTVEIAIAN